MKRAALGRRVPLRRGERALERRVPLRRMTPLARQAPPERRAWRSEREGEAARVQLMSAQRRPGAASAAQRAKIVGAACIVCRQTKGITPAHLAPRALGGCDAADCVVPLCWLHHRAYDTGRLELLPYLEPRWRAEIGHAVSHLGLIGAYRRLTRGTLPAAAVHAADAGG